MRFAGSAQLVAHAAPGVKCIGLQEEAWIGVSVIGNIPEQEQF